MNNPTFECVGLHVAIALTQKQKNALISSIQFLKHNYVVNIDLDKIIETLEFNQNSVSFDLCDVILILRALVNTIDAFDLNNETAECSMNAYRMHYIFNKIRYQLEYGGN